MWTVTEMPMPLFTVEETFSIKGRGLVIVGIAAEQYGFLCDRRSADDPAA
jgi:hypothetical protein